MDAVPTRSCKKAMGGGSTEVPSVQHQTRRCKKEVEATYVLSQTRPFPGDVHAGNALNFAREQGNEDGQSGDELNVSATVG